MDRRRRSGAPTVGGAGGSDAWHPSPGYVAVALAVAAIGLATWLAPSASPTADAPDNTPALSSAASGRGPGARSPAPEESAAQMPAREMPAPVAATARTPAAPVPGAAARAQPRTRDADGDPTPDLSDYLNPGETPTVGEVIDRLHRAGVHSGLGAFSPPGTRPPLVGLAVPEDFVLPQGYVRHHQATDDGQRIEPILMFSPDFQFADAGGQPIGIPKDRVVPPELAPPGLPIRRVVIPAPAEPGRAER